MRVVLKFVFKFTLYNPQCLNLRDISLHFLNPEMIDDGIVGIFNISTSKGQKLDQAPFSLLLFFPENTFSAGCIYVIFGGNAS